MFRFESPQYLYLLLVLVALTAIHYYIIYRKKQQIKSFGDPELTRQLFLGVSRWRPEVKFWITMLAVIGFSCCSKDDNGSSGSDSEDTTKTMRLNILWYPVR